MYPSTRDRLRLGIAEGYMTYDTFRLILREHARGPEVRLFSWRGGPTDRVTIYDYSLPRRMDHEDDIVLGWTEEDWNMNSMICNVPVTWMSKHGGMRVPSYTDRLQMMLREGAFLPSRCLDEWLRKDSQEFCGFSHDRLRYLRN